MDKSQISNIIFDLGGVLVDLDVQRTVQAFKALSTDPNVNWKEVFSHEHLLAYEQGLITDTEFRDGLRKHLSIQAEDQQLDDAWNAMILHFPDDRFPLLEALAQSYNLYLLSNTNEIHIRHVNDKIRLHNIQQLDDLFHTAYYSQRLNLRKPHVEIYHAVLEQGQLDPAETLFIDDNAYNIAGAKEAGLHTHHLTDIRALPAFFAGWY